jgi:hypothetical protein
MVLQQFAQDRQSVSFQVSISFTAASESRPRGGLFSSFVRNLLKADLLRITFFLNNRRLIASMLQVPKILELENYSKTFIHLSYVDE